MLASEKYNILFSAAMIALTREVGAERAVKSLFATMDSNVRYQDFDQVIEMLFANYDLKPGSYISVDKGYQNEDLLKDALAKRLEDLSRATSSQ